MKAGTIASAVEEKAAVEALSTTEAIDAYVAEVTKAFADEVLSAIEETVGTQVKVNNPAASAATNVELAVQQALVDFTLNDSGNEVTISAEEPVSSVDVGVTTYTSVVTISYSTGDDLVITVELVKK